MNRFRLLATVVGVALAGAVVRADLIPPDTKNIAIDYKIETDKELADWVFFVVNGKGGITKVEFDPKKPLTIAGSSGVGRGPVPQKGDPEPPLGLGYRTSALAAVPKDAVKKYDTEKELLAAVGAGKVEGQVRVKDAFADHTNAKVTDPRKSIVKRFKITKIDAKDGIVLEAVKDEEPAKDKEEEGLASRPAFRWVAIGLALAAGVGFAGLLLTRRGRRS